MSDQGNIASPARGPSDSEQVPRYKIGTVASMVGVSTSVLRAWERRYNLPHPARQSGKQRLYTDGDVRLLRRIVEMTQHGLSIGEVVALGRESLLGTLNMARIAPTAPQEDFLIPEATRAVISRWIAPAATTPPPTRYAGESLEVSVRALALSDAGTLHRLYQVVKSLYELWTYMDRQVVAEILERRLRPLRDSQLLGQIAQLGAATGAGDALLEAALHDAREGALTLLLERVAADQRLTSQGQLNLLVSLGRDHAKVLRNAFADLDPALREADEHLKAHEVMPILSKIAHLRQGGWVQAVGTDFHGYMTCRCLETSTLDRLLYRYLALFRKSQGPPPNLWVTHEEKGWVRWAFEVPASNYPPPDPGGFVARTVGLAAGLTADQAVQQGLLGRCRAEESEWLWFYWPSYAPPPEVARCGCHPLSQS